MDTWKKFEQNVITHSAAHHLMAIDALVKRNGYARVSDVARLLEITRGSVSISLKPLKADGLVEQDENRFFRLTERGQRLVDILLARRHVLIKLLTDVLGVDAEQAEIDACKVEHLLSAQTAQRMTELLRFLGSGDRRAQAFMQAFDKFERSCEHEIEECPCCEHECIGDVAARSMAETD